MGPKKKKGDAAEAEASKGKSSKLTKVRLKGLLNKY
jgi:hypothetical protein